MGLKNEVKVIFKDVYLFTILHAYIKVTHLCYFITSFEYLGIPEITILSEICIYYLNMGQVIIL